MSALWPNISLPRLYCHQLGMQVQSLSGHSTCFTNVLKRHLNHAQRETSNTELNNPTFKSLRFFSPLYCTIHKPCRNLHDLKAVASLHSMTLLPVPLTRLYVSCVQCLIQTVNITKTIMWNSHHSLRQRCHLQRWRSSWICQTTCFWGHQTFHSVPAAITESLTLSSHQSIQYQLQSQNHELFQSHQSI